MRDGFPEMVEEYIVMLRGEYENFKQVVIDELLGTYDLTDEEIKYAEMMCDTL